MSIAPSFSDDLFFLSFLNKLNGLLNLNSDAKNDHWKIHYMYHVYTGFEMQWHAVNFIVIFVGNRV